ncbi:hypothetical protein LTR08_004846 [Meristemomyces frigidus]|nr:hypothetical protein LTR08_004846 [Meristemomyces frigidus]
MSRFGGPPRGSGEDLAYGDIPQRWDRDRFERFGSRGAPAPPAPPAPPSQRYEEDYRFEERERPGRRQVQVADRIDENGPGGHFQERDRYYEDDRYAAAPAPSPGRPRRRTDKELFGDVDPRDFAGMALQPYRRQSRPDLDVDVEIDRRAAPPPRPGLLRRQSSLDTFDRRPAPRFEREDYRVPAYTPVPLPIRRPRDEPFEEVRYQDFPPEDYREVEIQRERSVHRRAPKSRAGTVKSSRAGTVKSSKAASSKATSKAKSVTTRRSSPSSESSESFEEIEREDSIHESIRESLAESERKIKKGKTRMPKRLVRKEAVMDLGYPFDEEEDFLVLRIALEKEQIDEVIKISEQYKEGGTKKLYRFEEKEDIQVMSAPPMEHEEVLKTEWVNPPTVVFGGPRSEYARSVRAPSPARTATTRRPSPARTYRAHSRRPSSPGTFVQERRTIIEDRGPPPLPPPMAIPIPPPAPPAEYYEDRRTIIEERAPAPSRHGGELVLQERTDYRSDRDINHEIRALEAERRALRLEREAEEKRDMAVRVRERPQHEEEEFQMVEYRERRPGREVLEVVERERSPARNVVRVEKDRKGRMALVRSAH